MRNKLSDLKLLRDPRCRIYLPLYSFRSDKGRICSKGIYNDEFSVSGATRNGIRYITKNEELVVNGGFVNTNNWTAVGLDSFDIANGRAQIADATPPGYITQTVTGLEVGKLYLFKVGVFGIPPNYPNCFIEVHQNGNPVVSRSITGGSTRSVCNHFISVDTTAEIRLGISSSGQYVEFDCCSLREITYFDSGRGFWFDDIDDLISGPQLSTLGMENQFTWIIWVTRQSSLTRNETPFFSIAQRGSVYLDSGGGFYLYLTTTPSGPTSCSLPGPFPYQGEPYMYAFMHNSSIGQWARAYSKGNVIAGSLNSRAEPMDFSTANIKLGYAQYNAARGTIIHELAMFNRALSDQELYKYYSKTRRRYE